MSNPIIVSQMPAPEKSWIEGSSAFTAILAPPKAPAAGDLTMGADGTLLRYSGTVWEPVEIVTVAELARLRTELEAATLALYDLRTESTAYRRGLEAMRERSAVIAEKARINVVRDDGAVVGTQDAPPPRIAEAIRKLEV